MVKVKIRTEAYEKWLYETAGCARRDWDFGDFLKENAGKVAEMDDVSFYHLPYEKIKKYIWKIYDDNGNETAVL